MRLRCRLGFHSWIKSEWFRDGIGTVGLYINNKLVYQYYYKSTDEIPNSTKKCIYCNKKKKEIRYQTGMSTNSKWITIK